MGCVRRAVGWHCAKGEDVRMCGVLWCAHGGNVWRRAAICVERKNGVVPWSDPFIVSIRSASIVFRRKSFPESKRLASLFLCVPLPLCAVPSCIYVCILIVAVKLPNCHDR